MGVSMRLREVSGSPTLALDTRVKQLASEGCDVVNFGIGEPDFPTPAHVAAAGQAAIGAGETRYTAASGTPALRRAIAAQLAALNHVSAAPEQVVVTAGAKQALYYAYMAILEPGDEVLLPAPYWVSYPEIIRLAGGQVRVVPTKEADGFKLTPGRLAAAITPRTRALNLNSPGNPTGAVYTAAELAALAAVALDHGLWIVSDEIYERLVFGTAEHVSVASLGPEMQARTVTVGGMSKTYCMTGWRLGWAVAPPAEAKAIAAAQSHLAGCPSSVTQAAALAALTGDQAPVAAMRAEFDRRRRFVLEQLARIPGVTCYPAQGAFYVFPNLSAYYGREVLGEPVGGADDLCAVLLEKAHVALVPGTAFGSPEGVRLSYATAFERIAAGMERLAAALR